MAPCQSQVKNFQPYRLAVDGLSVAACQPPPSTMTSAERIGVPSLSTMPNTRWRLPFVVTRAMNDLRRMRVMAVSFHFISPLTISPLSVRYQRAWYLPRYASSWTWISARYLTFGAPYQPGTSNRSGKPWNGVSGSPFSA